MTELYERLTPVDDIQIKADGTGRVIDAYAAVFGVRQEIRDQDGHYFEVIHPYAFQKTLEQRQGRFQVLYNHGFCIFNNVAIAAEFALSKFNLDRVLIVDFDVHHGNGTQDAFYADPEVLYFSTHQYPFYPGTGSMDETGTGEGEGTTVNFPMAAGWGDEEYLRAFNDVLVPVARRFQRQLILVSAGFDAHWADHLAMMKATIRGFARMATVLTELAAELCQGRLVFTLEGGYNLRVVASSIRATFDVLLGGSEVDDPLGKPSAATKPGGFDGHIETIKRIHHVS